MFKEYTPMQYLAIDIANQVGEVCLDKKEYDRLTKEIDKLTKQIERLSNDQDLQQMQKRTS